MIGSPLAISPRLLPPPAVDSLDKFQREAYELISGPAARRAFDVNREAPKVRDRYGRHNWGQSCLLARRLVEAGVTFVTVHMGGWDHHSQIEPAMKNVLPILDRAIAELVQGQSAGNDAGRRL
ncbi:MAG TPA: DUF1501 domain-containing protein [Gemmataceae bacterium]|nr:DUF1501 domain-containing protein [Gemmataceae bacterium]